MKKTIAVAALAVAAAVSVYFYKQSAPPPTQSAVALQKEVPLPQNAIAPESIKQTGLTINPVPAQKPRRVATSLAAKLNAPDSTAAEDVVVLHGMLRQYLRFLKDRQARPIGNDSDLARVLIGNNPMKLVILPPDHPALGADGRLRDRFGTPYFIHPRGHLAFEIRSAGPDRKLFTDDDLIENPSRSANATQVAHEAETPEE